jgi:hypothetical protein
MDGENTETNKYKKLMGESLGNKTTGGMAGLHSQKNSVRCNELPGA